MKKALLVLSLVISCSSCNVYHQRGLYGKKNHKKWSQRQCNKQYNTPGAN